MPKMGSAKESRNWLLALGLVIGLHVAVWWGYTHFKDELVPPQPLPVVQVSLLTPSVPVEPHVALPRPLPQKVERLYRQQPESHTQPVQAIAERAAQQDILGASTPVPAAALAATEPVVEPPRYNAAYLSNPPPAYPLVARRRGIEGTVLVRAEVAAGGECLRAELKKTSGHDMLDQAALEAVRQWHFVPARRGSQAVVAWVEVPIRFKLESN